MDGFVVMVDFRLKSGARTRFLELIAVNAASSVRDEPGCRRFDILTPRDVADRIALYEIYDDLAAFEAHKRTPHYLAFKDRAGALIEEQTVGHYDLQENAVA